MRLPIKSEILLLVIGIITDVPNYINYRAKAYRNDRQRPSSGSPTAKCPNLYHFISILMAVFEDLGTMNVLVTTVTCY